MAKKTTAARSSGPPRELDSFLKRYPKTEDVDAPILRQLREIAL